MKKLLILLASTLLANDPCAPLECAFLPVNRRCQTPENCLENIQMYGWFDFLYWEGIERGLEFATQNSGTLFDQDLHICEPDFDFNPAFRIGAGYHLPHDFWDLEASWTRYYTHTTDHANGGILSVWTCAAAFQGNNFLAVWQDAHANWHLHANIVDLDLKHRLCLTSSISFEPAIGLKLALFQQHYKALYENGNTALIIVGRGPQPIQFMSSSISMNNRSFNIGPSASVVTRWNIWDSFDFLGTLSGSLLASRFSVNRKESDISIFNGIKVDNIHEENTYWTLRPQAAATFGFGWSQCLCRKNSVIYYGLSASYEAQIFWKQNMLYRFIDQTNAAMIAPTQGNLFFHGLTLEGFIDF
ncbi:MAG: hypothetical protein K1X28_08745 [Parachlamydiales bacterium]|nr:hypothetical protein [Parachlamydiales bacterium]